MVEVEPLVDQQRAVARRENCLLAFATHRSVADGATPIRHRVMMAAVAVAMPLLVAAVAVAVAEGRLVPRLC